ncbi:hypothetical protein [Aureibacter tunicatorum]|uniref:Uncharacterized protein n=1 Tax=Aureibacter tunicatorum TaxID=866807 RepID=A0AAE3XT08_9BACT|nr:hypothetical protein [Aureibacter tunicatorum]MDR6241470.1 hypothetical protein [Aureibacter tunicatorum]BDD06687.1 hypothetical protein AUTU_41700 [Aureibacter tunicatorum]
MKHLIQILVSILFLASIHSCKTVEIKDLERFYTYEKNAVPEVISKGEKVIFIKDEPIAIKYNVNAKKTIKKHYSGEYVIIDRIEFNEKNYKDSLDYRYIMEFEKEVSTEVKQDIHTLVNTTKSQTYFTYFIIDRWTKNIYSSGRRINSNDAIHDLRAYLINLEKAREK